METNLLLFSVEMDAREILSSEPNLGISVNAHGYMTTMEFEQFKQLIGAASKIVTTALIRSLNEGED